MNFSRGRRLAVCLLAPSLALLVAVATVRWSPVRAADAAALTMVRADLKTQVVNGRQAQPMKPVVLSSTQTAMVLTEKIKFTPETGFDAVAVIVRPVAKKKYPTVLVQHFLGGSKDHFLIFTVMQQLAAKGYLAAAIDGRFRGERQNGKSLEAAMVETLKSGKGQPFLYDTAYDLTRFLDYLETREDVEKGRIGMTGFSEGGMLTWITSSIDERIQVAVPFIGVTSFREAFAMLDPASVTPQVKLLEPVLKEYARQIGENEANTKVLRAAWAKLVPGLQDRFDAPMMLPALAPRPVLVLNHGDDELFPVSGAQKAADAAMERYRELNVPDRFQFRVTPGLKHAGFSLGEVSAMMEWFEKWLKPAT